MNEGGPDRARSHRQLPRWIAAALCLAIAASACDSTAPPSSPTSTPGPTAGAVVSSVEITPAAIMFTGAGESKPLTAVARADDGSAIAGTATWASSDQAVATVDASGTVTAVASVGSTTVTATVNGVASQPTFVTITTPVEGAVLLTDDQIISGPTAIDPAGEPAADAPYEVVLQGVTAPAIGTILINTESKPVAGRVVSTTPEGDAVSVRLVVVPPGELFTAVEFSDVVDLGTGPYEIPADLAAAYDVSESDGTFVFSPKTATSGTGGAMLASSVRSGSTSETSAAGEAEGTRALPPLPPFGGCTATAGFGSGLPVPLSLSAPPTFSLTAAGTARREVTPAGTKVIVQATPKFTFLTALEVRSGFEAKVSCKATLVTRKFRVPGWAGLLFGGDVEFGVGFEVGGKVTLLAAKVGGTARIDSTLAATLDCPAAGSCSLSGDASASSELQPVLQAPSLNQAKLEPVVKLFGFIALEAGNADIEQLQFKAIELKAGLELKASLTLDGLQIDDTAAAGRSSYGLAFKGDVGPGIGLGQFLGYLGASTVVPLKLEFSVPLGDSPTGTAKADKPRYLPGDTGVVTVTLDAGSTLFPSQIGTYNVNRVVVARRDGLTTEVLGSVDATAGQTTFEVPITVAGLIDADELYAFVVTKLLPLDPPKLELGQASWSCDVPEPLTISSIDDNPDKIYVVFDGANSCRLVAEIGDDKFPGDGSDVALSIDTDPDERTWDAEDSDDDDGENWQEVSGFGQDLASGTHTVRSRHIATGQVFAFKVDVRVERIGGGGDTRMTVELIEIRAVN